MTEDSYLIKPECLITIKRNADVNEPEPGYDDDDWLVPMIGEPSQATSPKTSFLDPQNWKRSMLSEEEALVKFKNRANAPKYENARFKCTDCFTNFARYEKLQRHISVNHDESNGSHICSFCKRRFLKECKLRLHVKKHYLEIQCLKCHAVFDGEGLAFQHEAFHRGVSFSCKFCNHQFRHKSTYYQHMRTHHRSAHICAECGASFCSAAGLNVHKKWRHPTKGVENPPENYYCKRCDVKFVSVEAYKEHYKHSALHVEGDGVYEDIPLNNVIVDVSQSEVECSNTEKEQKLSVQCTICQKPFFSYQQVMKHHRKYHKDVPFMKKTLVRTNTDMFNCEVCGAYIKSTSLYSHMNAHTRHKLYACAECGMQFPYPTSLARHRVTHTGEKKYPCPLCEKRFTQKNSMQLHYRTYHLKEPYPKRNRRKKFASQQIGEEGAHHIIENKIEPI